MDSYRWYFVWLNFVKPTRQKYLQLPTRGRQHSYWNPSSCHSFLRGKQNTRRRWDQGTLYTKSWSTPASKRYRSQTSSVKSVMAITCMYVVHTITMICIHGTWTMCIYSLLNTIYIFKVFASDIFFKIVMIGIPSWTCSRTELLDRYSTFYP